MPTKFYIHLAIAVVICVWFIFQFLKHKRAAQIVIAVWAPLTLLTYVSSDKTFQLYLGIGELVIFLVVMFLLFRVGRPSASAMLNDALDRKPETERKDEE